MHHILACEAAMATCWMLAFLSAVCMGPRMQHRPTWESGIAECTVLGFVHGHLCSLVCRLRSLAGCVTH